MALAEVAGLELDDWQEDVLRASMGEEPDGTWSAFEVGLLLPRQNGKNEIVLAREIAGMFLLEEQLVVHSAHEFQTAMEHFRRLRTIIEDTPRFSSRLPKTRARGIYEANGREGIELANGQRVRFRARTKSTGRGLTGDLLVFDEAMDLPAAAMSALIPTLSTRPNAQIWYLGSAVDQDTHDHAETWTALRERGHAGDKRLAFFEWSLDAETPADVSDEMASDPEMWAQANPALGIRISEDYIDKERRTLDHRGFAIERLGVGDWPDLSMSPDEIIPLELWRACVDHDSQMLDPITVGLDLAHDRSSAAIASAGWRSDGLLHVEINDHRRGPGWLPGRLEDFASRQKPSMIVLDGKGPSVELPPSLRPEPHFTTTDEFAKACAAFYDAVLENRIRHLGTQELMAAIVGASTRPLGEAWGWGRKKSNVDISPLVAASLAVWAALQQKQAPAVEPWVL